MVAALASMDLCEHLAAVFLGYAPYYDIVGTTPIENPLYQCVFLSHTNNLLSGYMFIRKDIIFQVVPDLRDPSIRVHGVPHGAYDP
jgi:hypothetical protein